MAFASRPKIVFGAGAIGDEGDIHTKFTNREEAQAVLDLFKSHGHKTIDTARAYPPAAPRTSEPLLGETDFAQWAIMDTKVWSHGDDAHSKENIAKSIAESLEALKVPSVDIMYLHVPCPSVPYEETCEAMNKAYEDGKFKRFGLSNYSPQGVEDIMAICERRGFVKPTVYQGHYNAIARLGEADLFPVLRKHGIAIYAYSPSASGIFTGKITADSINTPGSRWSKDWKIGEMYSAAFLKDELITAAQHVHAEAQKHSISGHAVALRWILHHSELKQDHGDGIVIGASSMKQLDENLKICDAGPLPDDLAKVVEDIWPMAKPVAPWAYIDFAPPSKSKV